MRALPRQRGVTSSPSVQQKYVVAVRELCAFAAKAGDLDHRFTPSPSAQEGLDGHKTVATRRGAARRNEVAVTGEYKQLTVRGRADGLDESQRLLEEVKTHRGDLQRMPANHRALHWAQAKVYGALLCRQLGFTRLNVSLVYFEIDSQRETILVESLGATELEAFFAALCESFLAWAEQELVHRKRRDASLRTLSFPHEDFRTGQRQLAENVFRAARLGRDLMVEAPTGIGKTMATLYPMLKGVCDRRTGQGVLPDSQGLGAAIGARCSGHLASRPVWHFAASPGARVSREELRAPRQVLSRRLVSVGAWLL